METDTEIIDELEGIDVAPLPINNRMPDNSIFSEIDDEDGSGDDEGF